MQIKQEWRSRHDYGLVLVVSSFDGRGIVGVLQGAGIEARSVPSGLHAQQVLMAERVRVAIVVADQDLVGIDGLDLLILAKDRWPRTRRILIARRPRGDLVVRACTHAGARVLIKPVLPSVLVRTVQEELENYGTQAPRH